MIIEDQHHRQHIYDHDNYHYEEDDFHDDHDSHGDNNCHAHDYNDQMSMKHFQVGWFGFF